LGKRRNLDTCGGGRGEPSKILAWEVMKKKEKQKRGCPKGKSDTLKTSRRSGAGKSKKTEGGMVGRPRKSVKKKGHKFILGNHVFIFVKRGKKRF